MIKKTLKTTHGKLLVAFPSQLSEVSLGQMMALQGHEQLTDLDAVSILSGIPVTLLQSVTNAHDFVEFADAVLSLSAQIKHLYHSEGIPKKITVDVEDKPVTVNVIRNLSVEPAGAFMAARDIIGGEIAAHIQQYGEENWQESFNPSLAGCCTVLAHYLYCRATGRHYDDYAASAFTVAIKKLRVTEALPIARHFFTSYPGLSKQRTGCWHRLLQRWKNARVSMPLKGLSILTP